MKTAISVPDQIFEEAEELARQTKKSRSQIYAEALREYLARHTPDAVTEAMDRVVAEVGAQADEFVSASTRRVLERSEW
jgi:metal-responsive CopG/Arc/MetJ family transcriptional regulator